MFLEQPSLCTLSPKSQMILKNLWAQETQRAQKADNHKVC